ncbi:hypothetical protein BDZ89DRAFT_1162579 [Hymenopellis radicata]|nr:hypothetical protein BDZ89DRAFT_1162579 [Hymenopellis radicata]
MNPDTLPTLPYADEPAKGPPPPYIARSDAALLPGYYSDWSQVQSDPDLPWFIKPNREAFISYLQDRLLIPPKWFHALEEFILSTGKIQQSDPRFHWCLRLLYYQPNLPRILMTSDLARQIFCEIIWITLTPKPYEWLGGCEEIGRRTGWDNDDIKKWFDKRSKRSVSVYHPPSVNPKATIKWELIEKSRRRGDRVHYVTIRPAAAEYLSNPNLEVQWDRYAFEQCVTYWLKDLANRCTALNHFFLDPLYERPSLSTICGIHVGPF